MRANNSKSASSSHLPSSVLYPQNVQHIHNTRQTRYQQQQRRFSWTGSCNFSSQIALFWICLSLTCSVAYGAVAEAELTTLSNGNTITRTSASPTQSISFSPLPITTEPPSMPGPYPDDRNRDLDSMYDPPYHAPGLTDEEFHETWHGAPNTLKIGVLLPFTPENDTSYKKNLSRISLSIQNLIFNLPMDGRPINTLEYIFSQQYLPGTNVSGGAAAISATTRLMALGVGAIIGDISSEFTAAEAIMTSSVGIPQCSFATYVTQLSARAYLLRTVPGVLTFMEALFQVILHYKWKRISILYTSDLPGLLGEKLFAGLCDKSDIEALKIAIPLPGEDKSISMVARGSIKNIKKSDTRIHVLIASRATQVDLLDLIRDHGLFDESHVWLTPIDLSDSIARLDNSVDFNGLIMTDALWEMPGVPAFDSFLSSWMKLDPERYPHPATTQLTWHQTFAYTCLQLVLEANKIANATQRDQILDELQHGRRSQDLTLRYIGSRTYDTPIGNFTITRSGEPMPVRISIMSFQNNTSIPNGRIIDDKVEIFNPIKFKNGKTEVPGDSPSWDELNPDRDSGFGLAMTVLSSILMFAIFSTAVTVILNRDNIIIKSASVSVINQAVSNKYLLRVVAIPVLTTLLRNLWLQKRGLHVAAGREVDPINGVMASDGSARHGEKRYDAFDSAGGAMLSGSTMARSERASFASTADMHGNPNISDLISSYPFGQLSGENNGNTLVTSPVHRPTNYGQSTLMNRSGRKSSRCGNNINGIDEQDESIEIEDLDLADSNHFPSRSSFRKSPANNIADNPSRAGSGKGVTGGNGRKSVDALHPKIAGYDTFGRMANNQTNHDAQPMSLQEVLKVSTNRPNDTTLSRDNNVMSTGLLPTMAATPRNSCTQRHSDIFVHDYFSSGEDVDPQSRKSSFGSYGFAQNRSPSLYPLLRNPIRETRMDSFTVTAPVQRQRWYILRILAQWRMSKIIFVPNSKLLVIVDLETETSESLILHSIERGYSPSDYPSGFSIFGGDCPSVQNKHASGAEVTESGAEVTESGAVHTVTQDMPEVRHENTAIFPKNKVAPASRSSSPPIPSSSPPIPSPSNDTQQQKQQYNIWRRIRIGSNQRLLSAQGRSEELMETRQRHASTSTSISQMEPRSFDDIELTAGEPLKTVESTHQSSFSSPLNTIKHFSLNFGLDFRNMDGIHGYSESCEMLEGITSDYVIRVISIHNQCWRVQLPDQETMDRWIEIGQQIKDENWITRPIVDSKAVGGNSMDRRRSSLDGGPNNRSTRSGVRRGVSFSEDGDALRFAFPKPRPQPREASVSLHPPRATLHPLQHGHESSNSHHSQHPQFSSHPQTPTKLVPFPRPETSTFRMHSDTTESSVSSNDTDRQRSREHAARINQQMRSSSKLTPFRALIRSNNCNGSSKSGMSIGSGLDFGLGASCQLNSNNSINDPARTESSSSISLSFLRKLPGAGGSISRLRALPTKLRSATRSATADTNTINPNTSSSADANSSTNVDISLNPALLSVPFSNPYHGTGSGAGVHLGISEAIVGNSSRRMEKATDDQISIQDVLAETNIAYENGQHAFYKNQGPGSDHRTRRHSNNIQYNYKRKRSSANILEGIGGIEEGMDISNFTGDSATGVAGHDINRVSGSFEDGDGFPFPRSPEWHLTSIELEKMEADDAGRGNLTWKSEP
ncbi:hypothetical protein BGX27_007991 [Mortierella sp. AM989]|nr:hypothetical protein BGX27_007991 [Mortierella sp. AM989]